MFVVEVGAVAATIDLTYGVLHHADGFAFSLQITIWLWFTLLFANFAEAMAEGRGKAQAETLRKSRAETVAHRIKENGDMEEVSGAKLRSGDVVLVVAGELIPGDGEVIEGIASVDESAITGESAPVIRESGGDRSAVTGGTRVLSDQIRVKITSNPGETFIDRMIKLVEGAERKNAERNCAEYFAGRFDDFIFAGSGDTAAVRGLFRGAAEPVRAGGVASLPDSDDDRRIAVCDWYSRNGPAGEAKRAGDVRARGGSGGRCGYVAAGQDRDDYFGEPRGNHFCGGVGSRRQGSGERGADGFFGG